MLSAVLQVVLTVTIFKLFGPVLCLADSSFFSRDAYSSESHIVDTGYAKYRGNFTAPFSLAFLGVPYAEPPVGNLRFRSPVPLDTDRPRDNDGGGVVDATSYPDFCVQGSIGEGDAGGAGTEDCLKVNIYTPVNATSRSNREWEIFFFYGLFE